MQNAPHIIEETPLDVLIVGAGLSGIGAACQLQRSCPNKRFAIIEAREAIGGTWDLFRYPGIRSDSDMHTLGYAFKPWSDPKAIADGSAILRYIKATAKEAGIEQCIKYGQKVCRAAWSSDEACWTVEIEHVSSGARSAVRARFLYMCSGYYSYETAYRPEFAGESEFKGKIVLPQFWPKQLDYTSKQVVVVGSGATAVTLVPAMAHHAAHVTMLQRSPTYIVNRPSEDRLAQGLNRALPAHLAYRLTRWKNITQSMLLFWLVRSFPEVAKRNIVKMAQKQLEQSCDANQHFAPRYKIWDQRVCVAPDGDFFSAIRQGRASVITDTIERFTPTGIRLRSGLEIKADIVVLATGLQLKILGGVAFTIDGRAFAPQDAFTYKGMMFSDVPNLALAFGYTNASWTLKADLTAAYVCRLLRYMDRHGKAFAVPRREPGLGAKPFLSFTSGYVQRSQHLLPKQGTRSPWQVHQNYLRDLIAIRFGRIDDGVMQFGSTGVAPGGEPIAK